MTLKRLVNRFAVGISPARSQYFIENFIHGNSKLKLIGLCVVILISQHILRAQTAPMNLPDPMTMPGISPFSTLTSDTESVNLANGNVHAEIPLLNLPGIDGFDLNLRIIYDSKQWGMNSQYLPNAGFYDINWINVGNDTNIAGGFSFTTSPKCN